MLPLQVTLLAMSKRLVPAVEDCHQLKQEPALTHFQMLQNHNTQKALIQHICLSYALFLHRQHSLAVSTWLCSPSTNETQSLFSLVEFMCWANTKLLSVCWHCKGNHGKHVQLSSQSLWCDHQKLWKEPASPLKPLLSSAQIAMDSCVLQSQFINSAKVQIVL